jgi:hypothetical protein
MAPVDGPVGDGPICKVAVGLSGSGSTAMLQMMEGDTGSAVATGSTLVLACALGGKQIMQATIDCYQGPGYYTIPAGSLELGGMKSDRNCQLDVDIEMNEVRGFIGCDMGAPTSSVFANTQPPIGLGSYSLPFTTM